jgi:hypothetical protein
MNTLGQRPILAAHLPQTIAWSGAALASSRDLAAARSRRERILAVLAFVMLIVAWDATLRLDERTSPPRVRMSHAVDYEGEAKTQSLGL